MAFSFNFRHHGYAFVLGLCLAAPASAQQLTVYDGMDYGATPGGSEILPGQNGGFGWNGPWFGVDQSGLLCWWPLDGTTQDAGPLGVNGVLVNAQYTFELPQQLVWSTHAITMTSSQRGAVDFSANASKFRGLGRGSITAWMKTDRATGSLMVIFGATNRTAKKSLQLYVSSGTLFYDVNGNLPTANRINGGIFVSDDQWHHVGVTVDASGFARLYVDGFYDGGGYQGFFNSLYDMDGLWIGRIQYGGPTRSWHGSIDDVAVWGNVLTTEDMQRLASMPPPLVPGTPQPVGPSLEGGSLGEGAYVSSAYATRDLDPVGDRISEPDGLPGMRRLRSAIDLNQATDYYISFLVQRSTVTSASGFELQLSDTTGVHLSVGWDVAQRWVAGLDKQTAGIPAQSGTTYFVVAKVDSELLGNDTVYVKAYSPSEVVHADESQLSGFGGGIDNWTVGHAEPLSNSMVTLQLRHTGLGGSLVEVDELRIGKTWESVTSLGYGAGCLGARIGKANRPAIGSTDFVSTVDNVSANVPAFLILGGSRTIWGVNPLPFDLTLLGATNCDLLASMDVTVPTVTDGSGQAALTLPVPAQGSLAGRVVYAQWASVDSAGRNTLPLAFSNAMELVFEL